MLTFLHLVWSWLIGWGGLSLLVAIGAGAVWWFIPAIFVKVKALAFNVAIGALAFNFVFTTGYQSGVADEKAAVIAQNARDKANADAAAANPDGCNDSGGMWNVITRRCERY